eukprot:scpid50409/ scgid29538/ RNA-binding protein Musashi homolog 1
MSDESNSPSAELAENGHSDGSPVKDDLSGVANKRSSHDGLDSAESSRKMFVGGLNRGTNDDGLREYFAQFGEIESCLIKCDPTTHRSRGFGFVTFKERSSVDRVLATTHMLDERKIDPKLAVPYPKSRTRKIFVGGLPAELADGELRHYFGQFGTVDDVELPIDRTTGGRKGFGFISFENEETVEAAMRQTFHTIGEYTVEVKRAVTREQSTYPHAAGNMRNRGAMGRDAQSQQGGMGNQGAMQAGGYAQAPAGAYQPYASGGYAAAQQGYNAAAYAGQMYSPYSFGAYAAAAAAYPYYYPYPGMAPYGQQVPTAGGQPQQQQQPVAFTAYTPTVVAPSADSSSKYGPVRNNSTTQSAYRPY